MFQFGGPYELLCDTEGGLLADLVGETGAASKSRPFEMTWVAYLKRINGDETNKRAGTCDEMP